MNEETRRFESPEKLADAVVFGKFIRSDGVYHFATKDDESDVVVILDTTGSVGPVSGRATWIAEVQPHPWGQVVAETIWESLDDNEVEIGSPEPYDVDVGAKGWTCFMRVVVSF
jgi:hypothetical protein